MECPDFIVLDIKTKSIELHDDNIQERVHSFCEVLCSLIKLANVEKVGIKARATGGDYAGGSTSYKIEGLIQALSIPVEIIHPGTIAATIKKASSPIDYKELGLYKYQNDALQVAYYLL